MKNGAQVESLGFHTYRYATDFIARTPEESIAVGIRSLSSKTLSIMRIDKPVMLITSFIEHENIDRGEIVVVLRDNLDGIKKPRFIHRLEQFRSELSHKITIRFGIINEDDEFELVEL